MILISLMIFGSFMLLVTVSTHPAKAAAGGAGIALTMDDDYIDEWYSLRSIFSTYGAKATFFVTAFDELSAQQINELKVLQSEGCEIACHGYRHIDAVQYTSGHTIASYVSVEITPAINAMKAQGFNPTDFAWPYGSYTDALNTALLSYFTHLRIVTFSDAEVKDEDMNYYKWDGARIMGCMATDNIDGRPVSQFTAGLDKAKANGWVLIVLSHRTVESTANEYVTPPSKLAQIVKYAHDNGIKFYTVSELTGSPGTPTPTPTVTPTPTPVTINVGPTRTYKTITAGLAAANAGDTILVDGGTYAENLNVAKNVTIKAADGATPIVDAGRRYPAIWIKATAPNARVEGLTIQNSGPSYTGIYVEASGVQVVNNKISGCGWGVYLTTGSGSTVKGNTIDGATSYGIEAHGSGSNTIDGNTLTNCAVGVRVYSATGNLVKQNDMNGNTADLKIESGSSNSVYLNNFKGTVTSAGTNTFNTASAMSYTYNGHSFTGNLGNYWPGYAGVDANANGVGDTAYTGPSITDSYPLMGSWTGTGISGSPTPTPRPAVAFTATPTTGVAPLGVTFTDRSTGIISSWAWDFGDSHTSSTQNPGTHIYSNPGSYTASLTVAGPGGSNSTSTGITVTAPTPTPRPAVAFTATPTSGPATLRVVFTDKSNGIITSWAWNFGDGATSNIQNPGSHDYVTAGSYTASLTVTGPGGSNSTTTGITVTTPTPTPRPVVAFTATPTSGGAPLDVTFTDRSTGAITSYLWEFGDGGTSSVQSPGTHTYSYVGSYTAKLTVTGPGGSNYTTTGITVTAATPTPTPSPAGIALTFDDSYPDDWYTLVPLFQEYGVKATFFVTTFDRLTPQQVSKLKTLQSMGCEIACHGYRHLDAVSYTRTHTVSNYVSTEITPAINAMKAQGITPTDFAWPYGTYNSALTTALQAYFDHLRAVTYSSAAVKDEDFNYYKWDGARTIGCMATDNIEGRPVSQFTAGLDRAKANGWVLITLSHRTVESTSNTYITPPSKLEQIIKYAHDNGLTFYTVSQLQAGGPGSTPTPTPSPTPTATPKPVVAFTATPTSGGAPLSVTFTDRSTGAITSYLWEFGDGATSSVQSPGAHSYTTVRSYTAKLTVTGPGGTNNTTTVITVTVATPTPTPGVINVGPTRTYKTITAGLAAASAGNTILLDSGTYAENVRVTKTVTIKAADGATPIVDAGRRYPAIWITAANVRIEGLTIQNGGPSYTGVYVAASGAQVVNNKISGCGWGVFLTSGSGSTVSGNAISGATSYGIEARSSGSNVLKDNTISGSSTAIRLYGANGNTVSGNGMSGNTNDLSIQSSSSNVLYMNDFRGGISVSGTNTFNSPTTLTYQYNGQPYTGYLGNYWSAYTGADANGDGIGDATYTKTGYSDKYPLKSPHASYTIS